MDSWQKRSLDSLRDARKDLDCARSQLGNDHPAYTGLEELIRKTVELEDMY